MMALCLGLATAGLIAWLARIGVQSRARIDQLPHRAVSTTKKPMREPMQRAGMYVMSLPMLRTVSVEPMMYRAIGAAVIGCPAVAVVSIKVAVLIAVALIGGPLTHLRGRKIKRRRAIERDMPMIIDLVNLSIQSGLTIGAALAYVVRAVDSPVSDVYRQGLQQLEQGRRMSEVLSFCEVELGDVALALTSALRSAERYGSPLSETLAQLVQETRFDLERRAEKVARRLSVQLLLPVAGCILPAFALLTVAPLIAGSFGTLASSFH
jgi:Flp pilus assembly protein TadB